ncbi:MAG: hypothetical protein GYA17_18055 [Chloroflexi bacterium]|jgi:hypothetical protein|nr:hypothetical protein [Chloroflexota bacterium]
MSTFKWIGGLATLVICLAACTIAAAGDPGDTTPVAWVNEEPISRGTLVSLAESIQAGDAADAAAAYQSAFDLLVQNALFLQEATRLGLVPSETEVEQRVTELLRQAQDNPALQELYSRQAAAQGTSWDSPQFEAYLQEQMQRVLPAEVLNRRLNTQAQGDAQQFNRLKAGLLTDLLAAASIRLDPSALPAGAGNLHIPRASELPAVRQE